MMLKPSILNPYYRQNVGFYLLIFLSAFGFMRLEEHKQLSAMFMARLDLLLFAGLAWTLHVAKTSFFVHKTLQLPSHLFLRDFTLLPKFQQFKELAKLQFNLNLPFFAYAIFMLGMGIKNQLYTGIACVLCMLIVLFVLPVFFLQYRFQNFISNKSDSKTTLSRQLWPQSEFFWYLRFLLSQDPLLFFSTKLFSFLIIMGLALLYPTDDYDYRLVYLSVFFAGIGQFAVGRKFGEYLSEKVWFMRNLPMTASYKLFFLAANAFILCLFEVLILFRYRPEGVSLVYTLGAVLLMFAFQFFWLAIVNFPKAFGERFSQRIYIATAIFMLLIMYKVPVAILAAFLLIVGGVVYLRFYEKFEGLNS